MGLFDFVKEAGEGLLGKLTGQAEEDSKAVQSRVQDLGLGVEGLKVRVEGDRAVLEGQAASQADAEKAIIAAGNIPGIAQVDDRIAVAKPAKASQYYKVQKGDSLSKIAKQFYGDAMKYPQIFEANKPMLKDPDKIYPGQVLRIPALD
ncbi:MAG: peptidoglycan-binding protein LysM [Spirochaetaceae bacterium]|nr:peptidoglycan-binding protein LysM [Myxococcales bacterium]MCB9725095.1 peptidoglycan-binding protein LysM [Spirochaetaceae bacterium]HPG28464.1 peptidoglycan-binding protein LysM [Myxococcota bacterium]